MTTADERVTFRLNEGRLDAVEELVGRGVYPNRSAALRAAVDGLVESYPETQTDSKGRGLATDGGETDE